MKSKATEVTSMACEAIDTALEKRDWHKRRVCGLQETYCRQSEVTPYFCLTDLQVKPGALIGVEGAVGIIWCNFEENWQEKHGPPREGDSGLCVILHLANVGSFRSVKYMHIGSLQADADRLAGQINSILSRLPDSVVALKEAFLSDLLLDRPIVQFSGYSNREKFVAFAAYVRAISGAAAQHGADF
jgi:hypothetical protein